MKRYIIFYLLVLIFSNIDAQSDFKDAYILISENDTVFGQIDNKNFQQNSLYCDFRKNENDKVVRYYPMDLYAYRFINGKYYIAKSINTDSKNTSFFFEYLIKGELDIYFLQTELKKRYYISEDGMKLYELKYSEEIIREDGKMLLKKNKRFVGMLEYYTADYPELKTDIRNISSPSHDNMINISKKYHNLACETGECIIYEKKNKRKLKIDISTAKVFNIDDDLSFFSYNSNVFFQLSQENERAYIGLGLGVYKMISEDEYFVLMPLSLNYIHPKIGFSPLFSYTINFPYNYNIQTISIGSQYKRGNAAFILKGGMHTSSFVGLHSVFISLGLMLDLN